MPVDNYMRNTRLCSALFLGFVPRAAIGFCLILGLFLPAIDGFAQQGQEDPGPEESSAEAGQAEEEASEEEEANSDDIIVDAEQAKSEFNEALRTLRDENPATAASLFYTYITSYGAAADDFEWAQYFLGDALQKQGYWHGAVLYYYEVARSRRSPEILPEVLRRLSRIHDERSFSERLVLRNLVYDTEFGDLTQELRGWTQYVQGLYDYYGKNRRWGNRHFETIPGGSAFGARALYVRAVTAVREGKDDAAVTFFRLILEDALATPRLKNQSTMALARLMYDLGEDKKALGLYEKVIEPQHSFDQAQVMEEKAWVLFQLGRYAEAMGLLHALSAPSYREFFLPESYLLKALILKDLCHYVPAKRALRAFRFRFDETLELLRQRRPISAIPVLVDGGAHGGRQGRRTEFLRTLETEKKMLSDVSDLWHESGLQQHLSRVYTLEIREQSRLWHIGFRKRGDEAALRLLEAEEQVELLDYEIGLDIFQRLGADDLERNRSELRTVPYDSDKIYYEFDGEFWNDELHHYNVFLSNQCLSETQVLTGGN